MACQHLRVTKGRRDREIVVWRCKGNQERKLSPKQGGKSFKKLNVSRAEGTKIRSEQGQLAVAVHRSLETWKRSFVERRGPKPNGRSRLGSKQKLSKWRE